MQRVAKKNIWDELCGKPPTKEKRREFAKQNLGNTGHKNLNDTAFLEYYPGTAHLGFGHLKHYVCELQKLQQVKCAFFKLVHINSDCIVPENIYISSTESFFGLTHLGTRKLSLALLSLQQ